MAKLRSPQVERPVSFADQVYSYLKEAIVSGRLEPGGRLRERALAQEFGVSPTPVREAIRRLEQERLVETLPNGGVHIRSLTQSEVAEILDLREQLEGYAAERAAHNGSDEFIEVLRRNLDTSRHYAETNDLHSYQESDIQFHRLIRQASGNNTLCYVMESLQNQIRLGMATSMVLPTRGPAVSFAEHIDIVAAIESGDGETARSLTSEHVRKAKLAYLESVGGGGFDLESR